MTADCDWLYVTSNIAYGISLHSYLEIVEGIYSHVCELPKSI